jgi:hypothetical protein
MVAAVMNFNSLMASALAYSERPSDAKLNAEMPNLLVQAENRIAADAKMLGTQQAVTGALTPNEPTLAKPAFWRKTTSMHVTLPDGTFEPVFVRSYEFCRAYSPLPTDKSRPLYYADYDYENFFLSPTPDVAYPIRIVFDARVVPLSDEQQENWLTLYAPQLLLRALMLEIYIFLKSDAKIAFWQGEYQSALGALKSEDGGRIVDRASA